MFPSQIARAGKRAVWLIENGEWLSIERCAATIRKKTLQQQQRRRNIENKKQFEEKNEETMNCATMVPDDRFIYEKDRSTDRRTSRGLASCLRGESEEYYDYEAEGKLIYILHFYTILLHLFARLPFEFEMPFGVQFRVFCCLVQMNLFWNSIFNTGTSTRNIHSFETSKRFVRSADGALVSRKKNGRKMTKWNCGE